jgi:hypothetical protein
MESPIGKYGNLICTFDNKYHTYYHKHNGDDSTESCTFDVFCTFQTQGFIFRKTDVYAVMVWYGMFYMHQYKQSSW